MDEPPLPSPYEIAIRLAADGLEGDYLGCAVAIRGDTAPAGAQGGHHAGGADSGAAHVHHVFLPGDLNCDGAVDFADINPFVLLESDQAVWRTMYPDCPMQNGDINGDGTYGQWSFGDINLDGLVDFGDINPFIAVLTSQDTDPQHRAAADINRDGVADFGDINPFVLILSNPVVWQQTYAGCPSANGDIDANGSAGFEDINPFVALIVQAPIECQY